MTTTKDQQNQLPKKRIAIRVIALPAALKKQIADKLGCSVDTVRNALVLTNPRSGEQPDRIRRLAKEYGGAEAIKYKWVNI